MTVLATKPTALHDRLYVIHPLDDVQERKCSSKGLGPMELTPAVRRSLLALRAYLLAMALVVAYRALVLAHVFGHTMK